MDTKVETEPTMVDTAKLAGAVAIALVGFVAYYYFGDASVALRSLGVLVALGLAVFVGLQSVQGQSLWRFIQAARAELRRVVWPTREETIQTTIAVLVFALIMGVFFWLLDLGLLYATSKITGQGGL
ncbi:MAG TPA: preprotein translocase subunit SecE [Gammaproteobacteria bacterium]|nr:preprotein translocase subunit SecE [Gammaproteobacteria bacterium]